MQNRIRDRFDIKEILKFLVGGGSAVITDAVVYALLKQRMDVSAAKAVSYVMGAAVGFVINKLWTFQSRKFRLSEVFRYIMLYACSAAANTLVNRLALLLSGGTVFAFLCATGTSTVINFLGQKFFVFSKSRTE